MNKFLQTFKIFTLSFFIAIQLLPVAALAQNKAPAQSTEDRCKAFKEGFKLTNNTDIIGDKTVFCSATQLILSVITYVQIIAGTVTALFLMIGGFLYITSAGNEEQSEKGRKILINSVIGLVVIIMSYAIVRVISSLLTLGK